MANTLTIDQASALLREVMLEATGQREIAALNTHEILTIGQKYLATGYDPVLGAISQVISRTIFSSRPYNRKFGALQRDPLTWGNIVRKITQLETPNDLQNNDYIPLEDDTTVDQYKISKPKAIQLNFVGQYTYEIVKTIFDTQLNVAFNSAEDFGRFMSDVFLYVQNKIEKIHEETARATVAGFIGGKIAGDTSNVIHLRTEYNADTGAQLTEENMFTPGNVEDFMRWIFARVKTISDAMTEYGINFHTNLEDGVIMRHTPKEFQMCYLYGPVLNQIGTRVLSTTFHNDLVSMPGFESVNFWQNPDSPDTIHLAAPEYLGADGAIKRGAEVNQSNVFGVIFDVEAMGYSPILTRTKVSPYNARGEYYNTYWKFNERNFLDFTENGVVLLLD